MSSQFIIYGLTDPRTGEVRYIGKSSSGMGRPKQHAKAAAGVTTHRGRWIQSLSAMGLVYGVVVLEELATRGSLDQAERRWIAHGLAQGWSLTNGTAGGDGGDTRSGTKNSDLTRARISAAKKGVPALPHIAERLRTAFYGKVHSPATIAKMSSVKLGKVFAAATREKMSESARRRAATPAGRAQLIENGKNGSGPSAQTARKISAAMAGRPKPYMAARNKARVWTAEMRAKIGETMRRNKRPRIRINLLPATVVL